MRHVNAHEFREALVAKQHDPKVKFVDVRTTGEYKASHIEGVQNIPLDQLESHHPEFADAKEIYIQCASGNRSAQAVKKLYNSTAQIYDFCGGLTEWKSLGYPVIEKKGPIPIIRQVMIVAGSLVLLGVILSQVGLAWGVYLSAFVGIGLLFAGISGWCGMATLLGKMPWNK